LENRSLLSKLLQSAGFEVYLAINGQEAVDHYEKMKPDLIWMDIEMPVMDGYEATKRIRELETQNTEDGISRPIPIIALTAHAFDDEKAEIMAAGCDDFVSKPFREAEIFEVMGKHLWVRYVYEQVDERKTRDKREILRDLLTPEALMDLPDDLLAELKQAIIHLDVDLIQAVIERIHGVDATIADELTDFVKDFQYEKILALILK